MGLLLQALDRLLPDPHPPLVIEIGDREIAGARREGRKLLASCRRELPETALDQTGVQLPDGLAVAIEGMVAELAPHSSRMTALLLPDSAVRLALFEFESLPRRAGDLRKAVEARFQGSLPYDVGTARVSFQRQRPGPRPTVLAAAAPLAYVRHCEQAVRLCGFVPTFVSAAAAGTLNMVGAEGTEMLLRLSARALTVAAVADRTVKLLRRISLPGGIDPDPASAIRDVMSDVLPTLAFLQEHLGAEISRVLLTGFGVLQEPLLEAVADSLAVPSDSLPVGGDAAAECGPGLLGYVHG